MRLQSLAGDDPETVAKRSLNPESEVSNFVFVCLTFEP